MSSIKEDPMLELSYVSDLVLDTCHRLDLFSRELEHWANNPGALSRAQEKAKSLPVATGRTVHDVATELRERLKEAGSLANNEILREWHSKSVEPLKEEYRSALARHVEAISSQLVIMNESIDALYVIPSLENWCHEAASVQFYLKKKWVEKFGRLDTLDVDVAIQRLSPHLGHRPEYRAIDDPVGNILKRMLSSIDDASHKAYKKFLEASDDDDEKTMEKAKGLMNALLTPQDAKRQLVRIREWTVMDQDKKYLVQCDWDEFMVAILTRAKRGSSSNYSSISSPISAPSSPSSSGSTTPAASSSSQLTDTDVEGQLPGSQQPISTATTSAAAPSPPNPQLVLRCAKRKAAYPSSQFRLLANHLDTLVHAKCAMDKHYFAVQCLSYIRLVIFGVQQWREGDDKSLTLPKLPVIAEYPKCKTSEFSDMENFFTEQKNKLQKNAEEAKGGQQAQLIQDQICRMQRRATEALTKKTPPPESDLLLALAEDCVNICSHFQTVLLDGMPVPSTVQKVYNDLQQCLNELQNMATALGSISSPGIKDSLKQEAMKRLLQFAAPFWTYWLRVEVDLRKDLKNYCFPHLSTAFSEDLLATEKVESILRIVRRIELGSHMPNVDPENEMWGEVLDPHLREKMLHSKLKEDLFKKLLMDSLQSHLTQIRSEFERRLEPVESALQTPDKQKETPQSTISRIEALVKLAYHKLAKIDKQLRSRAVSLSPVFAEFERSVSTQLSALKGIIINDAGPIAENSTRLLFQRLLPPSLAAVNGLLIDCYGRQSNELDIIIVEASAARFPLDEACTFFLVPVECAIAVIEIKSSSKCTTYDEVLTQFRWTSRIETVPPADGAPSRPFFAALMLKRDSSKDGIYLEGMSLSENEPLDFLGVLGYGCLQLPSRLHQNAAVLSSDKRSTSRVIGTGASIAYLLYEITSRPSPCKSLPPDYILGTWPSVIGPSVSLK
jgi:hypothetical protein